MTKKVIILTFFGVLISGCRCQVHSPKFPNNLLDMGSQMNGIAVIKPS